MKRLIFLNSVSSAATLFVFAATAFVMTPVIVRELGNRDYGVWEVMVGIVGYLGVLDLGVGPALVRLFAYARARMEHDEIERIFNTALGVLVGIGLLALLVLVGFAIAPERIIGIQPGTMPHLGAVFCILGVNVLVKFPGTVLTAYLQGVQRHYLMNAMRASFTLVQAVLIYVALTRWEGPHLIWLASIQLVITLSEHALYTGLLLVRERALRIRPSQFSLATLRSLYSFAGRGLLALVSARLRSQAMPLIIAHVVGIGWVVFFAIAHRITEYALLLSVSVGKPLMPYFSDLHAREDAARMRGDWFRANRFLQFLSCGLAIGIAFLGEPFIACWMGPAYAVESRIVVLWMALALFFEGMAPPAIQVLVGMNRHGRAGLVLFIGAAFSVLASVPLGQRYGLGGVAAAYALGASGSAMGTMVQACRAIEISVVRHFREGLILLAPALALEALLLMLLRQSFGVPTDYAAIVGQGLLVGSAYTGAWWVLTLGAEERTLVRELTTGLMRRSR